MKHLYLLIFILTLINCSGKKNKLADSDTFLKSFNQTEIEDLQLLFNFFNESICSSKEKESIDECYDYFFKKMEKGADTGNMELTLDFENQKRIYNPFSDSTFNEIWAYGKSWNYRDYPKDTFRTVSLNLKGQYINFLKEVGKTDKVIKNYYEAIEVAGDISPSLIAGLLMNHDSYNVKDIRVKFIIAIHYLTLNDQYKRKEKINKNSG